MAEADPEELVEPTEDPSTESPARKPRPLDPAIVALFPPGAPVDHEVISSAQRAWREATQREAPSIERLAERGTIQRVDVDPSSGYLAVTTHDDTWRAFVPPERVTHVLALMLRRPVVVLGARLAEGPCTFTSDEAPPEGDRS